MSLVLLIRCLNKWLHMSNRLREHRDVQVIEGGGTKKSCESQGNHKEPPFPPLSLSLERQGFDSQAPLSPLSLAWESRKPPTLLSPLQSQGNQVLSTKTTNEHQTDVDWQFFVLISFVATSNSALKLQNKGEVLKQVSPLFISQPRKRNQCICEPHEQYTSITGVLRQHNTSNICASHQQHMRKMSTTWATHATRAHPMSNTWATHGQHKQHMRIPWATQEQHKQHNSIALEQHKKTWATDK